MPDNDVDLMDVVTAINRLCDNMSNSYEGGEIVESEPVEENVYDTDVQSDWEESVDWTKLEVESVEECVQSVEFLKCKPKDSFVEEVMNSVQNIPLERVQCSIIQEVDEPEFVDETVQSSYEVASPSEENEEVYKVQENESIESLPFQSIEVEQVIRIEGMERWSDSASFISLPGQAEDLSSPPNVEPASEMYYTASSEVSLLSDLESTETKDEKERKVVIAGHVAAMRERFESLTRAGTPCPDAALDSRATPSPDLLG